MTHARSRRRSERGAVLMYTAIMLAALTAMSALAIDLGVMFVGRHQAQNTADAGALAAATQLATGNYDNDTEARKAGLAAAQQNRIWGSAPDVQLPDVRIVTPCPSGAPSAAGPRCARVDVFRTSYQRAGGSPLPTFFAPLLGIDAQGTRATATAAVVAGGGTSDCVKPFAVPDKWVDILYPNNVPPTFDRYRSNGNLLNQCPACDYYDSTRGYKLPDQNGSNDYGLRISFGMGASNKTPDAGWYMYWNFPGDTGGSDFRTRIATCSSTPLNPGAVLNPAFGLTNGPFQQGMTDLLAQDPGAYWDPNALGVKGAPAGGCMAAGTCTRSPRIAAVPVFDVQAFYGAYIDTKTRNSAQLTILKIIGVFFDRVLSDGTAVGYVVPYPTTSITGTPGPTSLSFVRNIILVR